MDEQAKQAWAASLRLLAATPKTRKELERKLLDKNFPEEAVQTVLTELETRGLLSDAAYAKNLAIRLTQVKPSGRRKLSFEMKRHGVPAKVQQEILSEMTEEDEAARAKELASHKWEQNAKLERDKRKKKVFDFLLRRGFDFQIARETIEGLEINHDDN